MDNFERFFTYHLVLRRVTLYKICQASFYGNSEGNIEIFFKIAVAEFIVQVNLSFDTEKENVENLKKLITALQELVRTREGTGNSLSSTTQPSSQPKQTVPDRTSGGCRVIPFEDMSQKMSELFSGRRRY